MERTFPHVAVGFLTLSLLLVGAMGGILMAGDDTAEPLPVSAIFQMEEATPSETPLETPLSVDPMATTASPISPADANSTPATTSGKGPSEPGTSVVSSLSLPRSLVRPTPFVVDPRCPPGAIPPLALLPTPTPVLTPVPTPVRIPLPPGVQRSDFYTPPGEMARNAPLPPFFDRLPGLRRDRGSRDSEVEIVNEWKRLYVSLRLIPLDVRDTLSGEPIQILLRPGQGERFLLSPGRWKVVQRLWEPEPPFPERGIEWPEQEISPRSRYKAVLDSKGEGVLYEKTHAVVVEFREQKRRYDPLSQLGKPETKSDQPVSRIGRIRNF